MRDGSRHPRELGCRRNGRHEHPHLPVQQRLDGLDALARNLYMRLFLTEGFTLRVQSHRRADQNIEIGVPALRLRGILTHQEEGALRE